MNAQLVSMDAPIEEGLLVTVFVESFGVRSDSTLGTALSAPLTRDDHTWQIVTLQLLQKIETQKIEGK